jgi:hypothetical protein
MVDHKKTGDKRSKFLKIESHWSIILQNLVDMDLSSRLIGRANQPFISKVIVFEEARSQIEDVGAVISEERFQFLGHFNNSIFSGFSEGQNLARSWREGDPNGPVGRAHSPRRNAPSGPSLQSYGWFPALDFEDGTEVTLSDLAEELRVLHAIEPEHVTIRSNGCTRLTRPPTSWRERKPRRRERKPRRNLFKGVGLSSPVAAR